MELILFISLPFAFMILTAWGIDSLVKRIKRFEE